jgi:23S rRNA (cytosine1962-C5)-methyltransferase
VFSGAIERIIEGDSALAEGDVVDVLTKQGEFIARGHYQIGSIAVRVLSFEREAIDKQWWTMRIAQAKQMREALGMVHNEATTCYRLVHGEGDLLPGLVVDVYGTTAVVQCHSVGMYRSRALIAEAIREAYGKDIEAIYDKSSQTLPFKADLGAIDGYLWGRASERDNIVLENGLKFKVNWEEGQKTGFFIDQRVNRDLVRQYSRGRKVLNTFCYTGGFSVAALAGGAREVVSIDLSERAVKLAAENVAINFGEEAKHEAIACNAVEYLKDIDDSYDLIILDPPAFAKHHKVLGNALQGYKKINVRALQKIRAGAILFTISCSHAVSRDLFRTTRFTAAAIAGRKVRIIAQLQQPADHPINI